MRGWSGRVYVAPMVWMQDESGEPGGGSGATRRIRVLLAEDFPAMAEALRLLLQDEFEVVCTVSDGEELVGAADRLRPEVIVTDVSMPRLDGISAAERIIRSGLACGIVFVSVHSDAAVVRRGLRAGGLGYVLKPSAGEELAPAVRAAARGERHVSPGLLGDEEVTG